MPRPFLKDITNDYTAKVQACHRTEREGTVVVFWLAANAGVTYLTHFYTIAEQSLGYDEITRLTDLNGGTPVTYLYDEDDTWVTPSGRAQLEAMKEQGLRVIAMPGGHQLPYTRPELVARVIKESAAPER